MTVEELFALSVLVTRKPTEEMLSGITIYVDSADKKFVEKSRKTNIGNKELEYVYSI